MTDEEAATPIIVAMEETDRPNRYRVTFRYPGSDKTADIIIHTTTLADMYLDPPTFD